MPSLETAGKVRLTWMKRRGKMSARPDKIIQCQTLFRGVHVGGEKLAPLRTEQKGGVPW